MRAALLQDTAKIKTEFQRESKFLFTLNSFMAIKMNLTLESCLQQKKLKKTGKKLVSSAKPELAILEVNWACAHTRWAALGEPLFSCLHGLELYSCREAFKKYFN
jgi:hypothetical protein